MEPMKTSFISYNDEKRTNIFLRLFTPGFDPATSRILIHDCISKTIALVMVVLFKDDKASSKQV